MKASFLELNSSLPLPAYLKFLPLCLLKLDMPWKLNLYLGKRPCWEDSSNF